MHIDKDLVLQSQCLHCEFQNECHHRQRSSATITTPLGKGTFGSLCIRLLYIVPMHLNIESLISQVEKNVGLLSSLFMSVVERGEYI